MLRFIRFNRRINHGLKITAVYLSALAVALSITVVLMRAQSSERKPEKAFDAETDERRETSTKPFFSLASYRTYGTSDNARLWLNYRNIEQIDFRVYRVKDAFQFFKQLDDPHQVGEDEKQEVEEAYHRSPTLLEKAHALKEWISGSVKSYVRRQLKHESRQSFNKKFRAADTSTRVPLNVADYARVPLINPDQMVSAWREKLPPLEEEFDRRLIPLGKREPGVYLVEAVNGDLRAYSVAIVTDLTLVEKTTPRGEMLVYAVDRKSGAPRAGVQVEVVAGEKTLAGGTTDAQGILKTGIKQNQNNGETGQAEDATIEEESTADSYLVMASDRDHFAISDLDSYYFRYLEESSAAEDVVGYVYTDRPVYRPNQTVYFKGIVRKLAQDGYEMVAAKTVRVAIEDTNGGKVFERDLELSSRGTFSGELDIADEAPLGFYRIIAHVGEAETSGHFTVEEYKKPEYKVKVTTPAEFVTVGERATFSIEARYFFGAPVGQAEVKYYVYRSRYYPSWWHSDETEDEFDADPTEGESDDEYDYGSEMIDEGEGELDALGRLQIEFDVPEPTGNESWDYTYRLEVQVTDAARRMISGQTSFVGTRGTTIAYASPERYIYEQGDTAKIRVQTTDYRGRALPASVTLKFYERNWEKVTQNSNGYEYIDYEMRERELSSIDVRTNTEGQATLDYDIKTNGNISIKTFVHEGDKTIAADGGSIWVSDRWSGWSDASYENNGSIQLIPDKKSYAPGETAQVLVILPSAGTHLLVTTESSSVLTARQIDVPGRTIILDVPVEARFAPNVSLNVAYVKSDDLYTGDQNLAVPARDKMLKLEVIPDKKEYKPREVASYTIRARNADGSPAAGAEVSLGVVDEAIYSIQPESAGDIRREFYGQRYNQVQTSFTVNYSFTGYAGEKPVQLARNNKPAYQLADFKNETEFVEPKIRREFKDTAFWQPDIVTNADGQATVKVKLPDNLTTWRATARAVTANTSVGVAVDKTIARKDLILRLETPRFLTAGDTVTISGIVHNFLKSAKRTRVSLEVEGARLIDPATQTLTIPREGERRVDWRVSATQAGEMKLLAKALTNAESDAVEIPLEIVPRGLKQAKVETISSSENVVEESFSLDVPQDTDPQARRLRVEAAPSVAGTLFGALDYLTGFPYGCTEQTMSRFLPNVIVAQALKDVPNASIRNTNDLNLKVQRGLERLYNYQHTDGGWGWWKTDDSDPFMTAYVIDGLSLARNAGYSIDEWRHARGRERLRGMLDLNEGDAGKQLDQETRAYMIYALYASGEADGRYADELFNNRSGLQPYGRALLALALHARGDEERARTTAREIEASVSVSTGDAHWESLRQGAGLHVAEVNNVEATALSLKALARISPESQLLPKIARWLVVNRRSGYYWDSTRDTAFAIFGLVDYLKVSRELSPDYTLEVYLNDERVLSRRVTSMDAASGESFRIERKGSAVLFGANRVRVVKRGRGALYLAARLEYFTGSEEGGAQQASSQLKLTREYLRLRMDETLERPTWKIEPLTGELRSGDLVVVRLRIEGAPAQYLMIEDPIPAGGEQVARVGVTNLNYSAGNWSDWYSAREFRDEKTTFFVNRFDGNAVFQYALRVQVPGKFRIAPARAELMYQPNVQANTPGTWLNVRE